MNRENEAWKSIYGTTGGEFDERSSDALVLRAIQESRGEKAREVVASQESVEEFQEHPEKIGDLVKELINLRGDKDVASGQERFSNIKTEGEWNKELRTHVGADGLPRDWAHLTGFLKKNPDRIADVLKEINDLRESANKDNKPEDVNYKPEQAHYNVYDEDSGMTDAVFERYVNKKQEAQEGALQPVEGIGLDQNDDGLLVPDGIYDSIESYEEEKGAKRNQPNPNVVHAEPPRALSEAQPPIQSEETPLMEAQPVLPPAQGEQVGGSGNLIIEFSPRDPKPGEDGNNNPDNTTRVSSEQEPSIDGEKTDGEETRPTPEEENEINIQLEALEKKLDEKDKEKLRALEKELGGLRPELAELYAKNRRFFVGAKTRRRFNEAKQRYSAILDDYLRLKSEATFKEKQAKVEITDEKMNEARDKVSKQLQDFIANHPNASQEEINAEKEHLEKGAARELLETDRIKGEVNAAFLSEYTKQQDALETETIRKIDDGTVFRRAVSKIITNKKLKTVLAVAGGAAVIAATAGIATGAVAVSYGLTATGAAMGAGRGALSGAIMSRQDSKNSAVRGFMSEEERKAQLENISVSDEGSVDTKNVANFLLASYSAANTADHKSNVKRTLISTGLGAIIGAAMSGVHFSSEHVVGQHTEHEWGQTGTEQVTESRLGVDIDSVNHKAGTGIEKLYYEMGGKGDFYSSGAKDIFLEAGRNNGLTYGKSGWTFPGPVGEWTSSNAQAMVREAAEELAKQGLLPMNEVTTGATRAVYGWVPHLVDDIAEDVVRNKIFGAIVQGGAMVGAGLAGGAISSRPNRRSAAVSLNRQSENASPNRSPDDYHASVDQLFETDEERSQRDSSIVERDANAPEQEPRIPEAEARRLLDEARRAREDAEASERAIEEAIDAENRNLRANIKDVEDRIVQRTPEFFQARGIFPSSAMLSVLTEEGSGNASERQTEFQNLWNTLDDNTKSSIRDYFRQLSMTESERGATFGRGRDFRAFVESQPVEGGNSEMPAAA